MNSAAAEASLLPSGLFCEKSMSRDLPWDIVIDILSRLPAKSLMRFKCVSTSFLNLISNDPLFEKQHLYHHQSSLKVLVVPHQNHTPLREIYKTSSTDSCCVLSLSPDVGVEEEIFYLSGRTYNSCDGLFCTVIRGGDVIIWNPSTRQARRFPCGGERDHIAYSLAHDSRSNVYKLLGVHFSGENTRLRFYSAETKTWRGVEDATPCGHTELVGEPTIVNGAFHWFCRCVDDEHWLMPPHVVSLDICDETYGMLIMPKEICPFSSNLCVVKGKLCVMCEADSETRWEIWVMNEYGVADSMARMFSFSRDELASFSCPLYTLDNVEIIMIYAIYVRVWSDPVGGEIKKKTIPYAFVESLVSPLTCLENNNNVQSRTEIVANSATTTIRDNLHSPDAMPKKAFSHVKQVWIKRKHYLKQLCFCKSF